MKSKFVYIRFGDLPPNGRSSINAGDLGKVGEEDGTSVYLAFMHKEDDAEVFQLVMPTRPTPSTFVTLHYLYESNRPTYIVEGQRVGVGSDGEPLLENPRIVRQIELLRG